MFATQLCNVNCKTSCTRARSFSALFPSAPCHALVPLLMLRSGGASQAGRAGPSDHADWAGTGGTVGPGGDRRTGRRRVRTDARPRRRPAVTTAADLVHPRPTFAAPHSPGVRPPLLPRQLLRRRRPARPGLRDDQLGRCRDTSGTDVSWSGIYYHQTKAEGYSYGC